MPRPTPDGPRAGEAARTHALAALRHAILSGDVAPGQRLVEEELAAMLGVTRQSLRAALLDLTAEGLVERFPNRGARVRVVSMDEAVAITECRMALEALCAVKAAQRITDEEAVRLRELGEQLKRAVADGEPVKYSALNRELHRRVGAISGQAVAVGLLDRLHAQLVRHQFQLAQRPGRTGQSLPEHLAIIDAVAGRRPADADRAIRRHLSSVVEALREASDAAGDDGADDSAAAGDAADDGAADGTSRHAPGETSRHAPGETNPGDAPPRMRPNRRTARSVMISD